MGGFNDIRFGEDQELILRMILAGYTFYEFSATVTQQGLCAQNRVTERLSATSYKQLHDTISSIANTADNSELPDEEIHQLKLGLAQRAWSLGRRSVRNGFESEARQLFKLSDLLVGRQGRRARLPVKCLYAFSNPVAVENFLILVKTKLSRKSKSSAL